MLKKYNLIAKNYLDAYRAGQPPKELLLEEINQKMIVPLEGLTLIKSMISYATSDSEIAYIAAGPLEDLFIQHYEVLFVPLDELLRTDINMRKALSAIWVRENTGAREALNKLLDKYNLTYGSL